MQAITGPWSLDEIETYLTEAAVPIRVAYLGRSGWPAVQSLWYLYDDGALWCATQATARIVSHLARDPRCAFEIAPNEPPYRGVRGQGRAEIDAANGPAILRALIRRFLPSEDSSLARWLLGREEQEVAIRIGDLSVASWDFTRRMSRP